MNESTTFLGRQNNFVRPKKKNFFDYLIIIIIVTIIAILSAGNLYFYLELQKEKQNNVDVTSSESIETPETEEEKFELAMDIQQKFAQVYLLPLDDSPTIINITDADLLRAKDPIFYENARNGDKIIILSAKKLVFIFREEEKKLINVAPIVFKEGE
jgi:hypothetical protein